MERILRGLEPEQVFYYFEELSGIPRGSGNEKQVSDYLCHQFRQKGFDVYQDHMHNLIIRKPATKGREKRPTVIVQSHLDMVCEKNEGTDHDFNKEPIRLRVADGHIWADGTTLGADNGIGAAMSLALLTDQEAEHPPLEIVLTADEERGMRGAINLDYSQLKGKVMINLDNGGEGIFTAGCAGGCEFSCTLKIDREPTESSFIRAIAVKGLTGGHSGADIHRGRINAIKALGRILEDISDKVQVVSVVGGLKTNAIPRESAAIIEYDDEKYLRNKAAYWTETLRSEYAATDSGVTVELREATVTQDPLSRASQHKLIDLINAMPNGLDAADPKTGTVISSCNLGVIETGTETVKLSVSARSFTETNLRQDLVYKLKAVAELSQAEWESGSYYPGWQYDQDSAIRRRCKETYEKLTGNEAKETAIHAGLECGYFIKNIQNLDAVAFGPVMYGAHTPDEHVDIASVGRTYELLKEVLKTI